MYNTLKPNSSLAYQRPAAFAAKQPSKPAKIHNPPLPDVASPGPSYPGYHPHSPGSPRPVSTTRRSQETSAAGNACEASRSSPHDLDIWLDHHNAERSHQGYRNMGKRLIDTINEFRKSAKKETLLYKMTSAHFISFWGMSSYV
jgi:hypothetical protein